MLPIFTIGIYIGYPVIYDCYIVEWMQYITLMLFKCDMWLDLDCDSLISSGLHNQYWCLLVFWNAAVKGDNVILSIWCNLNCFIFNQWEML